MFFSLDTVVRGYHIYKEFWLANFGEILPCVRETTNLHDPFAVAVLHERRIVGRAGLKGRQSRQPPRAPGFRGPPNAKNSAPACSYEKIEIP